jgi:hypothetical protein
MPGKARLILLHKGIDHEYRMTAPHADVRSSRRLALGKIPADDNSFADSTVTCITRKYQMAVSIRSAC